MGGKASIIMVLSFSVIFIIFGYNYGSLTNRAVTNEFDYYERTVAHDIAVSGANLAANSVFLDKTWRTGFGNKEFANGSFSVTVEDFDIDKVKIKSTGTFRSKTHDVVIILQPSSFARFAYYMNIFPGNSFFFTGDTITGPFHTQGKLNVKGSPVFDGKATAKNGLKLINNATPRFLGGFESGVDIPFNWTADAAKTAANTNGHVFANGGGGKIDVSMVFHSNETLTYKTSTNGGSTWTADTTVTLSDFAPNGVLFVDKGNLHIQGTINGRYTVVVDQSSGMGTGNIYFDDNLVYNENPLTHPDSDDMLGLICSNNAYVVDNAANRSNINIDASLFCYKGGLALENINMPASGTLKVFGGLIDYQAQQTGTVSGGTLTNGYHERVIFDERLLTTSPQFFPTTGTYEVVSWFE